MIGSTRAAFFAIMVTLASNVYAQSPPRPTMPASPAPAPPSAGSAEPSNGHRQPQPAQGTSAVVLDLAAIDGVIGKSVKSYDGEDMGRIVDLLVTPAGQMRAAVIDFGGLLGVGSRKVAVDWKALDFAKAMKGGAVVLNLTRNEVRVSPEYKSDEPAVVLEAAKPASAPAASTGK